MVIAVFVFTLSDSTEYHFVCSSGSVCFISSIDFLNKEQFRWRSAFREENNLRPNWMVCFSKFTPRSNISELPIKNHQRTQNKQVVKETQITTHIDGNYCLSMYLSGYNWFHIVSCLRQKFLFINLLLTCKIKMKISILHYNQICIKLKVLISSKKRMKL